MAARLIAPSRRRAARSTRATEPAGSAGTSLRKARSERGGVTRRNQRSEPRQACRAEPPGTLRAAAFPPAIRGPARARPHPSPILEWRTFTKVLVETVIRITENERCCRPWQRSELASCRPGWRPFPALPGNPQATTTMAPQKAGPPAPSDTFDEGSGVTNLSRDCHRPVAAGAIGLGISSRRPGAASCSTAMP